MSRVSNCLHMLYQHAHKDKHACCERGGGFFSPSTLTVDLSDVSLWLLWNVRDMKKCLPNKIKHGGLYPRSMIRKPDYFPLFSMELFG